MWQPAVVRFGVIASIAIACGGGGTQATLENRAVTGGGRGLTAAYHCAIEDAGFRYPAFPCTVNKVGERWILAKLGGSQRFRGEVKPHRGGYAFEGELYCPWGDCTQPLHGQFEPIGQGRLRGRFQEVGMMVWLDPAPAGAFGGAAYGGAGYGGASYGGPLTSPPMPHNPQP